MQVCLWGLTDGLFKIYANQDYSLYPDWLLEKADPIQRQLLGDSAKVGGHWQPSEFDVPLKVCFRARFRSPLDSL